MHLRTHTATRRTHPYLPADREGHPQSASSSLIMMIISRAVSGHRNGTVGDGFLFCGATVLGVGVDAGVGVADDLRELGTGVGVADVVTDVGEGMDEDTTGAGLLTFTTTTPESISRLTSSAALWNMKRLSRSRTVCFTCARLRAAREVCLLGLGFQ